MAGYSGTPLLRKLGIKDEHVVLLDRAPDGFELGETGARVVRRLPASGLDVTLTFQTRLVDLEARLPAVFERTVTAGMVWVCWPKKAAQKQWASPATSTRASCATSGCAWAGWT